VSKRSISISGHATSLWIETEFWDALKLIAHERQMTLAGLVTEIDGSRSYNLSSALRVYTLNYFRKLP
jgi:predicted DNA-binding ribbon-helix-helix protein